MKKYLALDSLFELIRLLSGAISAVYLTSKGLPLSAIAQLKMLQSASNVALEVPTGMLADRIGNRTILVTACLAGAAAFFCYFKGTGFVTFAVAELLISLCLSLWSGAFEAYALDEPTITAQPAGINRFFHLNSAFNSGASVLSGLLGGLMAEWGLGLPFALSAMGMLGLAAALAVLYPKGQVHPVKTVAWMLPPPELWKFFGVNALIQGAIQPLIYYWQPSFQLLSAGKVGLNLGIVFGAFQLSIVVASMLAARYSFPQSLLWISFSGLAMLFATTQSFATALLAFCGMEAAMTVSLTTWKAALGERLPAQGRATLLSTYSLTGRAGSFISLALISPALASGVGVRSLFMGSSLVACALAAGFAFLGLQESRKSHKSFG